jgi:hypothetical protein
MEHSNWCDLRCESFKTIKFVSATSSEVGQAWTVCATEVILRNFSDGEQARPESRWEIVLLVHSRSLNQTG